MIPQQISNEITNTNLDIPVKLMFPKFEYKSLNQLFLC
jgi:hypothetical protein